ncbi:MAG TPA: MFS transporter [Stellaceae bacterium]|nr:MFS transporter [Stellaceae bacterium]
MDNAVGERTVRKVFWRIVPFVMLLAIINYIDRINIGVAALEMNKDLGFSATSYGFGAGVFFIGYCFFEVPSNLILARVGVRRWLARIMVTWGIIATGMAWVSGDISFYVMRFLLGVAEAGFLPGVMYYFRHWLPPQTRGMTLAIYMANTALSLMIGTPLSTWIMGAFDGAFGLHGWQMVFILEGLPAVIIGFLVLYILTERPAEATWLSADEKRWLARQLEAERIAQGERGATTLRQGFFDRRVILISVMCFFLICANFSVVFWLPQIIKAFGGVTNNQVGLLISLVFLLASITMVLWGRHSDRTGDRRWHLVLGFIVGAAGLVAGGLAPTPTTQFIGLCFAAIGVWSTFGVFWALAADFLSGAAAAGGLALINSIGTFGGFAGPFIVGFVRDRTQNFTASLLVLAGSALIAAILSAMLRNEWRPEAQTKLAGAAASVGDD